MSRLYRVILKRHEASTRPNVCVFYDEDRETDGQMTIEELMESD